MFTQPCLIRKNTEELRDRLRALGYKVATKPYFEERPKGILCRPNLAIGVPEDCCEFNLDEYLKDNPNIIDCGTNEKLFTTLAALKDDSDKNQWFTDGDNWVLCEDIKFSIYWVYNDLNVKLDTIHKATPEELIEHFK